ncbi:hypothetical protein GUJ93_ZPchr0010g11088 [Zizania palustris]|uniref:Uncharacterized protein n=1 Tax=Zizania palustris TaxID=103762 RepID=A0A8J6BM86_ZIZPA|nr:hypothetical protein GUJ93_ZPchr0010g11088 [Zizania palustris]
MSKRLSWNHKEEQECKHLAIRASPCLSSLEPALSLAIASICFCEASLLAAHLKAPSSASSIQLKVWRKSEQERAAEEEWVGGRAAPARGEERGFMRSTPCWPMVAAPAMCSALSSEGLGGASLWPATL